MGASQTSGSDGKSVQVEVVTGEREAVYWEKVPEKVRRLAVEKAVTGAVPSAQGRVVDGEGAGGGAKRKRRRMK